MKAKTKKQNMLCLVDDLLDVLALDEKTSLNHMKTDDVKTKNEKSHIYGMSLVKLQEMINSKLNEAKHKYSAVMKYSITTN